MHILFFTDFFPPEVNAPASRTFEHCVEWVRAGHKVTVVTSAPNFPKGEVFPGYRNRLWQQEYVSGIRVIRVWTFIWPNEGIANRLIDQSSYFLPAFLAGLLVRKVDVVVGTSPNFFSVCSAFGTAVIKRVPWIFELRDIWPESIRALGTMRDSWVLDMFEKLELFLYRKSSAVIAVTNEFKNNLVDRGIDRAKIHVVTNGVELSSFSPRPKDILLAERLGLAGKFNLGYIGTHGAAHGLETLLEAAEIAQADPEIQDLHFLFVGHGSDKAKLHALSVERRLTNVTFIDTVPKAEVANYYSILDALVIHLRRIPLFKTVIPSKSFESMAMGIPILLGVEGEIAAIVAAAGAGLAFEPENAGALLQVARTLRDDPALRAKISRDALSAATKYDRKSLAQSMLSIMTGLVERR